MRPTNRRIGFLALFAVLALVLAACGPAAEPPPDTEAPTDTEAPPDTEAPAPPTNGEVEVVAVWTGDDQDIFNQVLSAFTEQTGVAVRYFPAPGGDLGAVLGTRIEGGDPPDLAMLPNPGLLRDLVARNALTPIEGVAGGTVDENYAPVWRELGSVDGTLYGVWFKGANKSTVWYNVPLFEGVGVGEPDTWEAWLSACDDFVAAGTACVAVGGADGWTLTDWFENIYLRTAGPELYDQLTEHEIPWTHDSVVEAMEHMAQIVGNPDFVARGLDGALQINFSDSVSVVFTDPPEAAMVYEGDFVAGVIRDQTTAEAGTGFDFFPFPSIVGSPASVVGGGDVAVVLTDNPAALELVRFLATPEAGEIWAARGGFSSPNQSVDTAVYPDEITRRSAEALAAAEVFRFDLSDLVPSAFGGTPGAGLFGGFQEWMRNPDDIDGFLQQMEQEAAAAFGG